VTGLFGGTFDPPHVGHVALVRAAKERFGLPRLTILVAEHPGHKEAHLPAVERLDLARAAFPDDDVRLDPYPRTIDLLRSERFDDPIFFVGADQFGDFLSWKEPDEVLELARLAVAARPGRPREELDAVLEQLLPQLDVVTGPSAGRLEDRLALTRAAFPRDDVRLDPYPRTVELLRAAAFDDPVFVIGADQFAGFLTWTEPDEVLERATLAVATRHGFPREELDAVLAQLPRPDRVVFLDIEPNPAASTDIRTGSSRDDVPPAVAQLIEARGLYACDSGLH